MRQQSLVMMTRYRADDKRADKKQPVPLPVDEESENFAALAVGCRLETEVICYLRHLFPQKSGDLLQCFVISGSDRRRLESEADRRT